MSHACSNSAVTSPRLTEKKWGGKKPNQKKGSPAVEPILCRADGVPCARQGSPVAQLALGMARQSAGIAAMARVSRRREERCSAQRASGSSGVKGAVRSTPSVRKGRGRSSNLSPWVSPCEGHSLAALQSQCKPLYRVTG